MIGENFKYDNYMLSDFGCILAAPEEEQSFVARSVISTDQSSKRPEKQFFGTSYDDILVLNFFIMKNPCVLNQEDMYFSQDELRKVRRWLESPKTAKELIVDSPNQGEEQIYYYGIFSEVQPYIIGPYCGGLNLTFQCNAPHGYSAPIKKTFEFKDETSLNVSVYSSNDDKYSFIYPVWKIHLNNPSGTLTIVNHSDAESSLKITLPNYEYIIIDSKHKQVLNPEGKSIRLSDLGFNAEDLFDYVMAFTGSVPIYWPRLGYGNNSYSFFTSVSGTVTKIEAEMQFIRKVDGF